MKEEFGGEIFTTFEVARLCGVFHTTVINWVNKGKLKARVTPGGHRRIPKMELIPFMKKFAMPIPAELDEPHHRILVLNAEPATARQLEKGFTKRKGRYTLETSDNPVDALVKVGKKLPDLFVMDLMMPVMDGFKVCQFLKSSPETKDMKIIVMAGKKLSSAQQEFLKRNVDGLVQKPFEFNELIAAVEEKLS